MVGAAFVVLGCTGGQTAAKDGTTEPTASKSEKFKVALITPGPVSDAGWNAMAYEGLQSMAKALGAEVVASEAQGPKIRDAMRTYAQDGYKLVIGHGYEYNEPGAEIAKLFPNTVFISSSGGLTAKNAGAFRFQLEDGFYMAGMFAAMQSKTGKLAMVGFSAIPSIASTFKAFEAGAKAANPKIVVRTIPIDLSADSIAVRQATLAVLNDGADFVIHQANNLAQTVFDACKEKGAFALGANANQNSNTSGAVVASAVIVANPAFLEVGKAVKAGTYEGGITTIGMAQKAIDFVIRPDVEAKLDPAVKERLAKVREEITSNPALVPKDKF